MTHISAAASLSRIRTYLRTAMMFEPNARYKMEYFDALMTLIFTGTEIVLDCSAGESLIVNSILYSQLYEPEVPIRLEEAA